MQTLKEFLLLPFTFLRFIFVGIPEAIRDLKAHGERHEVEDDYRPDPETNRKEGG